MKNLGIGGMIEPGDFIQQSEIIIQQFTASTRNTSPPGVH
jgi:hypothetical protein